MADERENDILNLILKFSSKITELTLVKLT